MALTYYTFIYQNIPPCITGQSPLVINHLTRYLGHLTTDQVLMSHQKHLGYLKSWSLISIFQRDVMIAAAVTLS